MSKHKYIDKHLSKNGKWVYRYSEGPFSKPEHTPSEYAQIKQKQKERKRQNKAKVFKRGIHLVDARARWSYAKVRRAANNPNARKVVKSAARTGYTYALLKAKWLVSKHG